MSTRGDDQILSFVNMLPVLSVITASPSFCRWPLWWKRAWWRRAVWWWATSHTETVPTFSGWSPSALRPADWTWTLSWMRYTIWEKTCDDMPVKSLFNPPYISVMDLGIRTTTKHLFLFWFFCCFGRETDPGAPLDSTNHNAHLAYPYTFLKLHTKKKHQLKYPNLL